MLYRCQRSSYITTFSCSPAHLFSSFRLRLITVLNIKPLASGICLHSPPANKHTFIYLLIMLHSDPNRDIIAHKLHNYAYMGYVIWIILTTTILLCWLFINNCVIALFMCCETCCRLNVKHILITRFLKNANHKRELNCEQSITSLSNHCLWTIHTHREFPMFIYCSRFITRL